jgi:hypothetical protein
MKRNGLAAPCVELEDECIATDSAHHRQQDTFGGGDCDRGIDGVATSLQDTDPDRGRHRVA